MASTKLNGTSISLYAGTTVAAEATGGSKIGAASSHTLSMESDMIDVTTKDSGGWKEIIPGMKSFSIAIDALLTFDETYGFEALNDAYLNRTLIYFRLTTETTGNEKFWGSGYISSVEVNAGLEEAVTYSVGIEGTAAITRSTTT